MAKKTIKQSLLIGALTSSFGVFLSKVLGLIYVTPLTSFAGNSNLTFYSIAYSCYDLLLKISGAGIPFAIAALVAKYYAKQDYKTVKLVRQLGTSIIMAMTFVIAVIFFFASGPLAKLIMTDANAQDVLYLKNTFNILLIALILVPFLSSIRGYYQGLKRLDLYASSQVLEQFIRVFVIIAGGYVFVRVMMLPSIYAIYAAIAAAGISALFSIVFLKLNARKDDKEIEQLILSQDSSSHSKKEIAKELIFLGFPYILISFFGNASTLVNSGLFIRVATAAGMDLLTAETEFGIISINCNKLLAIPQVLTLGFSSGLVPYLTESYEKQDLKELSKQISQILKTVVFLLIPCLFVFYFFADDIFFIMYGRNNLELGTELFKASTILGLTDTIAPITSSIMITLRLKKEAIRTLIISFAIKLISFFPLVNRFLTKGVIYSTFLCSIVVIIIYLIILRVKFNIEFKGVLIDTAEIIVSSFVVTWVGYNLRTLVPIGLASRIVNLGILAGFGLLMAITYLFVTSLLKLPQDILNLEKVSLIELIKKYRVK